jgi:hypothetical protein
MSWIHVEDDVIAMVCCCMPLCVAQDVLDEDSRAFKCILTLANLTNWPVQAVFTFVLYRCTCCGVSWSQRVTFGTSVDGATLTALSFQMAIYHS